MELKLYFSDEEIIEYLKDAGYNTDHFIFKVIFFDHRPPERTHIRIAYPKNEVFPEGFDSDKKALEYDIYKVFRELIKKKILAL